MVAQYLSSDVYADRANSCVKGKSDYNIRMSTLLEKAFEKARELPESDQNIVAAELLGVLTDFPTAEERAAIAEGRAEYERGDFVTHDEWRHEMGLGNR